MKRKAAGMSVVATLSAGLLAVASPAHAAAADEMIPYPGADGLLWIPEWTGDGGAVSGGLDPRLPTTLNVACQGDGTLRFTMEPGGVDFTADCPADAPATVSHAYEPGVLTGGFVIGIDVSPETVRWGLTVVQPE